MIQVIYKSLNVEADRDLCQLKKTKCILIFLQLLNCRLFKNVVYSIVFIYSLILHTGCLEEIPDGTQEQRGEPGKVPGGTKEAAKEEPRQQKPFEVWRQGDAGELPNEFHLRGWNCCKAILLYTVALKTHAVTNVSRFVSYTLEEFCVELKKKIKKYCNKCTLSDCCSACVPVSKFCRVAAHWWMIEI